MSTILVVDDESNIRDVVCFALKQNGYETVEAENGEQGLAQFHATQPDLVVLDIVMPEKDGTTLCRELRQISRVPVVFLTSRDDEVDRILGLELGGDDYITKPFSPRELVARVRAVLRRTQDVEQSTDSEDPGDRLSHEGLTMDLSQHKVWWQDNEIVLTATEFGMLRVLLSRPGHVFNRNALMDDAYELRRVVSDRTIDSHIRRLRNKCRECGFDPIETVHGVGYKLVIS